MKGDIAAVCTSPEGGIRKYYRPEVVVGQWGLEGDFHNREMRPSFSVRGTFKPNTDRHISIVALEVLLGLGQHLGLDRALMPGCLGENLTVVGLGNLSDIPDDTRLLIGMNIILRVSQQNSPCKNVRAEYGKQGYEWVMGRRGLLCSIERGHGERILPWDAIRTLGKDEKV